MAKERIITALDIGTTKICCIIAKMDDNDKLKIVGVGENKSDGLAKGMIKNIRAASESTDLAIKKAEEKANVYAENIYVGVAGELIRSFVSSGMANIVSESKYTNEVNEYEVTDYEIEKVKEDAIKNTTIAQNRKIIHIEPQFYKVDKVEEVVDPIGMTGNRLEAQVHIVTADLGNLNSIYKSLQRIGMDVRDVVLQPIASALAVLNDDEKELGAILVDIGGGTTDISIYYKNSIRFSSIIPFGGENITKDLSVGLRTPLQEAEKIKLDYGYAIPEYADENLEIEIPGIGGHPSTKRHQRFIAEIINPRISEIINLVKKEVDKSKYLKLTTAGISVSGGAANLRSTNQLIEKIFDGIPTKTGYPSFDNIYGDTEMLSNPKYATAVGLLKWGKKYFDKNPLATKGKQTYMQRLTQRIKNWFENTSFT